jgi:hypothetical protein
VSCLEEDLRTVLASLEKCQGTLLMNGDHDTAQLVSFAILELRIKLNRIEDSELKALCDAMLRVVEGASTSTQPGPTDILQRFPFALKLVK